jgi:hypothetical protein
MMLNIPTVKRYRTTGPDVEAVRFVPLNQREVADWCNGELTILTKENNEDRPELVVSMKTVDGEFFVHLGDYVVRADENIFYPLNENKFDSLYEEIEDGA